MNKILMGILGIFLISFSSAIICNPSIPNGCPDEVSQGATYTNNTYQNNTYINETATWETLTGNQATWSLSGFTDDLDYCSNTGSCGYLTGSGSANRLAYWNGTNTLTSNGTLTWVLGILTARSGTNLKGIRVDTGSSAIDPGITWAQGGTDQFACIQRGGVGAQGYLSCSNVNYIDGSLRLESDGSVGIGGQARGSGAKFKVFGTEHITGNLSLLGEGSFSGNNYFGISTDNRVNNPSFESGTTGWTLPVKTGLAFSVGAYGTPPDGVNSSMINCTQQSTWGGGNFVYQTGTTNILGGKTYRVYFKVKSNTGSNQAVRFGLQQQTTDVYKDLTATTSWVQYNESIRTIEAGGANFGFGCTNTATTSFLIDDVHFDEEGAITVKGNANNPSGIAFGTSNITYGIVKSVLPFLFNNNVTFNNPVIINSSLNVTGIITAQNSQGLTGNYTTGGCWMAFKSGIMYSTNCSSA
jgi:hypothetical protein